LPLSLTHKRIVAFYDADVLWVQPYNRPLTISDSSRGLKPIQKIFEDAKDLRYALAVGSSASQIGIKAMRAISVKIEGH
jgi:hypothetical protein